MQYRFFSHLTTISCGFQFRCKSTQALPSPTLHRIPPDDLPHIMVPLPFNHTDRKIRPDHRIHRAHLRVNHSSVSNIHPIYSPFPLHSFPLPNKTKMPPQEISILTAFNFSGVESFNPVARNPGLTAQIFTPSLPSTRTHSRISMFRPVLVVR